MTARLISALLIVFLAASCAKQATFEENYETAKANAATQSGTAYDNAVGTAVAVPGFALAQRTCVVNNPGVVSLHGYMRIKSPSDYSVVLEPEGAACGLHREHNNESHVACASNHTLFESC